MTDDIKDLIAEARKYVSDHDVYADNHLLRDLADALEAEVRHREEWATVGAVKWAEYYDKQIDAARDERDALRAQIEGHGGWDEWIAEHVRVSEENDALRTAIHDTPQREYPLPELMEISAHRHAENLRADILSHAIDTKGGE